MTFFFVVNLTIVTFFGLILPYKFHCHDSDIDLSLLLTFKSIDSIENLTSVLIVKACSCFLEGTSFGTTFLKNFSYKKSFFTFTGSSYHTLRFILPLQPYYKLFILLFWLSYLLKFFCITSLYDWTKY